jgi:hypothetical protein
MHHEMYTASIESCSLTFARVHHLHDAAIFAKRHRPQPACPSINADARFDHRIVLVRVAMETLTYCPQAGWPIAMQH